jgi:hypothetical protein
VEGLRQARNVELRRVAELFWKYPKGGLLMGEGGAEAEALEPVEGRTSSRTS